MDAVLQLLSRQHTILAGMLGRTVDGLTDEQFTRVSGETAPPIGWHLWHIARWGDRFQATLANQDAPVEIWTSEGMPEACGLNPDDLGVLQLGMAMDAAKAQALPGAIGRARFREYSNIRGVIQYAPAQESTLFADIMFHLTHSSRHLGSVEALRGL